MFSSSVVAVLVVLPFVAHSAYAQSCSRSYTVQEGDYCDSISAAQNASTYQLAAVNSDIDADCNNLTPGEVLCLGWVGSDCDTTYVVTDGDDCDIVASQYGINTTLLYQNNPQVDADCNNLYVGEVLCVATDVEVPVASSGSSSVVVASSTAASATSVVASTTAGSVSTTAVASSSAVDASSSAMDASSSAVDASSSAVVPSSAVASASATSSATQTSGDDGDSGDDSDDGDGDDDDLPWCDEL